MALTDEQIAQLKGSLTIKCIKSGGYTMIGYGNYAWAENEEQNLVDELLPDTLRANDYWTAKNMCYDSNLELTQCIANGYFVIMSEVLPAPLSARF